MTEPQTIADPLHDLPERYWRTTDAGEFMTRVSDLFYNYVRGRLSSDPEIISDFFIHFYERVPHCMETYRSRQDHPFTGFFITYLRHTFMNFIRKRRRRQLDIYGNTTEPVDPEPTFEDSDNLPELHRALANLPARLRLPVKLRHGMQLDMDDLRFLCRLQKDPQKAADLLVEYRQASTNRFSKLQKLRSRAIHLNYLLHSRQVQTNEHYDRWQELKRKNESALQSARPVLSYADIARWMHTTRSTVYRRVQQARSKLRTSTGIAMQSMNAMEAFPGDGND